MGSIPVYVGCAEGRAINVFGLDPDSGTLRPRGTLAAGSEIQWLASEPDSDVLYAALRSDPPSVAAFRAAAGSGMPEQVGWGSLPASMAYLSLDRTGKHLLGASYTDDLVSVSGLSGTPVSARRSPGRHAHCVLVSPDNRFVYATALGDDRIVWWRFDQSTGELGEDGAVDAVPASGPRHLAFSSNGERLYVLHEMSGTVVVYGRQPASGALIERQRISAVSDELNLVPGRVRDGSGPAPEANAIWSAELRLSPDGRFLYCTERSSSTISRFAVDPENGELTYLGQQPTETQPRGMNIDPSGRFLLVCGEVSNQLTVYRIDPASGSLSPLGRYGCAAGPRCIEFPGAGS